jgi:hypothetical protein
MIYKLIAYPVPWLFLAGVFAGGAIALLAAPLRRRKDPQKFRRTRPAKIYLLLTGVVACVTAALFASGSGSGFTTRFLFAFTAGLILSGLGLRFKKAAGIPLVLFFAASLILGGFFLSGWSLARVDRGVCRVVVLSLEPETALSVTTSAETETILRDTAGNLRVKTEFLVFPAAYLLFSSLPFYRVTAVLSENVEHPLAAAEPEAGEKILLALPGVHIRTVETRLPPLELFSSYELFVNPDGAFPPYFK